MSDETIQQVVAASGINMLAQIRRTPLVLGGMFLELTHGLYGSADGLYELVKPWSSTNEKGHTYIELAYFWDDANTDRRPAIIVDIGDLQISPDQTKGLGSSGAHYDLEEAVEYHEDVVSGGVTWAHLAERRAEAVLYASNTYDMLTGLSFVIKRDFCLEKFEVRSILKPRLQKEDPRTYMSEVQAAFQFRETYALKRESQKLKQIVVKAVADATNQNFNMVK